MKRIILVFSVIFFTSQMWSQGCSDAGFCSIGAMQHKDTIKHELIVGGTYEKADFGVTVTNPFIQYNANINRYLSLNGKLNFRYATDGTRCVSGFGDAFLNINYRLELEDDNQEIHFTLGGKAPLSKPDETRRFFSSQGLPTPMDFQSTLGTYDLIFGTTYKYKKLSVSLAYQQPLTSTEDWFYDDYQRQGDVLLKPSYMFKPFKDFTVSPSFMAIYRLGEDKINGAVSELTKGTDGLTLNLMSEFKYVFAEDYHIGLMAAVPVLNRKTILDGLKREYVFALSIGFNL